MFVAWKEKRWKEVWEKIRKKGGKGKEIGQIEVTIREV